MRLLAVADGGKRNTRWVNAFCTGLRDVVLDLCCSAVAGVCGLLGNDTSVGHVDVPIFHSKLVAHDRQLLCQNRRIWRHRTRHQASSRVLGTNNAETNCVGTCPRSKARAVRGAHQVQFRNFTQYHVWEIRVRRCRTNRRLSKLQVVPTAKNLRVGIGVRALDHVARTSRQRVRGTW